MLNVQLSSHRDFLPADAAQQKLFVMLKLRPLKQAATTQPSTAFAFVIDTSGSMREVVSGDSQPTGEQVTVDGQNYVVTVGGKTKIDIVIESLLALVRSGCLEENDRVAIVQFDDNASILVDLTSATQADKLEDAIRQLDTYSGGTQLGLGMNQTLNVFSSTAMASRRALIFTDGETFDEDRCLEVVKEFSANNIPITALGIGEYREDLLIDLSDKSGGRLFHIDPRKQDGTAVSVEDLPATIIEEFSRAQKDVVTNLALTTRTVKGVELTRVLRAYPDQAEFSSEGDRYLIGNAAANDETIFILEFTVDGRPPSRARIAQIGLTYDVPGQQHRGELPPQNLVVQFIPDQGSAVQVDREIMDYMQQCNISSIVGEATRISNSDPEKAQELLDRAHRMTVRIGNKDLVESLNSAKDELRKTRKLSSDTRKTVKMGSKGKTVKMGGSINDEISEEEIRNATGT